MTHFDGYFDYDGDSYDASATIPEIAAEPRLVGELGIESARARGGPLTRRILDALPAINCPDGLFPIIDTRCQRLMPGMYSAIPGWHCDDWPRVTMDSQPCVDLVNPKAEHFVGSIDTEGGTLAPMEVISTPLDISVDPLRVWASVHEQVEESPAVPVECAPGRIGVFGPWTIHRPTPARTRGWRFWFRLSFMHRKPEKCLTVGPEQVYVVSERNGW